MRPRHLLTLSIVLVAFMACASDRMDAAANVDASQGDAGGDAADTAAGDTASSDTASSDTATRDTAMTDTSSPDAGGVCGGVCVEPPPGWGALWSAELFDFDPGSTGAPEACPEEGARLFQGPAGAPRCAPCGCAFSEPSCEPTTLRCEVGGLGCDDLSDWTAEVNADCYVFAPDPNGELSCEVEPPVYAGECEATGGERLPEPAWEATVALCPVSDEPQGCGEAGQSCVASEEGICVSRSGEHACPEGWTALAPAFTAPRDTRSCSGCACDASAVTCEGESSYGIVERGSCLSLGDSPTPIASSAGCQRFELDGGADEWAINTSGSSAPVCPEVAPQPSGQVTGDPVTVCCLGAP